MPNQTPSVLQPIFFVAEGQQVSTTREDESTEKKELPNSEKRLLAMGG